MPAAAQQAVAALWIAWLVYWVVPRAGAKPVERRETFASRLSHGLPTLAAVLLMWGPQHAVGFLDGPLLPGGAARAWIGIALLVAGLAVTVWARLHLAGNWSGTVTLKRGHALIRSGPYRFVRHPIYAGLLLAFLGSAVARGDVRGLLAVLLLFVAFWRKLAIEERWMGERFGGDYARYRAEVAALVPHIF